MNRWQARNQSVFRVHAADASARARLGRRLDESPGVVIVEFRHDALPDRPWPELTDPRVRVAFAPTRRATDSAHFPNPSFKVVSQ
jgi:hypothetical protein